jgi:iron complex outermembrane recepter protein
MSLLRKTSLLYTLSLLSCVTVPAVYACTLGEPDQLKNARVLKQLIDLPLEQLFEQSTTTASRKDRYVGDTAAAVFVITEEDIRRSGAVSLDEVLRMAPGVSVTRFNQFYSHVAVRGFGEAADKLLVLVDGRSIYVPQKSQVLWFAQVMPLDNIARIEIVRGPGGTLWGSNAVNGVINIITKHAEQTLSGRLAAGVGDNVNSVSLRYGDSLSEDSCYRVHLRKIAKGPSRALDRSGEANDDSSFYHGGFRIDRESILPDIFSIQGNFYRGTLSEGWLDPDSKDSGANLLARWQREYHNGGWQVQAYYDQVKRDLFQVQQYRADTFDLDFQQRRPVGTGHEVIWGASYRHIHQRTQADDYQTTLVVSYDPASRRDQLFSLFAQDEITLRDERVFLTLGAKLEHNDYSGLEWQPNIRLLWHINAAHTFWSAISRAVRVPNFTDHDVNYYKRIDKQGLILSGPGNPDFQAENVIAYEAGIRGKYEKLSWDAAFYFNRYDKLYMLAHNDPYMEDNFLVLPLYIANALDGEMFGAELAMSWHGVWTKQKPWKLQLAYTVQKMQLHTKTGYPAALFSFAEGQEGSDPRQQISLRSSWNLSQNWDLDAWLRVSSGLPTYGQASYTNLDMRLSWLVLKNLEVALVGKNLLNASHREAGYLESVASPAGGATELERSMHVKLDLRW